MGQGHYTMLAFGLTNESLPDEALLSEDNDYMWGFEKETGITVASAYECEPYFWAIPLAVNDGFLQNWWKLPDLPYDELPCSVAPRTCKIIDKEMPSVDMEAVRAKWSQFQDFYRKMGIEMPDGNLILIADWD
ncbi:MAG: hypothetical protein JEY79_17240 [Pseudodesulfovibrio sp.]|nr:hypothetical protein [Pseudodesulfovibrio sp.]MBI9081473.1 hypothetical protein [Pseudodesulfovibrio sp.]